MLFGRKVCHVLDFRTSIFLSEHFLWDVEDFWMHEHPKNHLRFLFLRWLWFFTYPPSSGRLNVEAPTPTPNPEIQKNIPHLHELFEKFGRVFHCFPVTWVRNAKEIDDDLSMFVLNGWSHKSLKGTHPPLSSFFFLFFCSVSLFVGRGGGQQRLTPLVVLSMIAL